MINSIMYLQHEDLKIIVPEHISKWGVYSGQMFGITGIVAMIYEYYKIAIVAGILYISTVLYWKRVEFYSIIRLIDIVIVLGTIYYITFYVSKKFTIEKREKWIYIILIVGIAYIINNIIFYYQTVGWLHKEVKNVNKEGYKYFSLEYMRPNTENRELCYKYTMIVHSIFMHIVPGLGIIYCIMG